jgi:hypothetical protein
MSSQALNILSGIGAAVTGLAGEKVAKSGEIPGLDFAKLIPAMLGKAGGGGGIMGNIASAVAKSGVLNNVNVGELAGSLLSFAATKAAGGTAKKAGASGVAGLAAAILASSGKADLSSIALMAAKLTKGSDDKKGLTAIASELGKNLGSSGVSFSGGATAVKALDSVMGKDIKTELFKTVLKGLG